MSEKARTTFFEVPANILVFSPPPSSSFKPMVNGKLEMLPLAGVIGTVGHRFDFQEPGGVNHLKPGRTLSQSIPVNLPANAGWFVMLNGVNFAFVHNDPPNTLAERPLGQSMAVVGIDRNARALTCIVRLTDSNMDDPIHIIVDAVAVFFN